MRKQSAIMYEKSGGQQDCRHYWVIKPVAGPVSHGICKFCGEQKDFGNYLTECVKEDESSFRKWGEKPVYDKGERDSLSDIFSEIKGGGRKAVKASA